MKINLLHVSALLAGVFLAGCGAASPDSPPQKWRDADVRIETEPSPPRIGMNEMRIMVSKKYGKGAKRIVVSARTRDSDPWQQAYPDGDLGIFHTAINVRQKEALVEVKITAETGTAGATDDSVLKFPLTAN